MQIPSALQLRLHLRRRFPQRSTPKIPLAAFLASASIALTACQPAPITLVKETEFSADPYTITEQVYEELADFWSLLDDDYYQRVYVVEADGQTVVTLKQEDDWYMYPETVEFVSTPPKMVGDWLMVATHHSMWIWQPEQEAVLFDLIERNASSESDEGETEPAHQQDLRNDLQSIQDLWRYQAHDFVVADGKWMLIYREGQSDGGEPHELMFISEDQGKSFYLADS